ncbi:MAG: methyltransferase domain-containing protein [Sediminibacterium sp. Gen4]|jgi:2-polyprenyl-3-methyl-5-hydroxy-6-metoxy-1,4-benzoquinol methylase|uniref:methyltransferase domain-containing protein n=1 Tax=unclassified Sediminibacterium TaxID=2635961 RepID=UPI0015BB3743|nr:MULTISPECIES: methyltransferase domain-containing protein [unclassified Sediminibacterium]MBW0161137.1 methyltransferase domain-containing protein [Sediminibacterium sp.]MBW0164397.1 methyltransferase domain-containing protein [Sediminibacterium sp.]NWK65270.1 methyltransferase domain-containing protein [Sediminibacterium sp. Gen4]
MNLSTRSYEQELLDDVNIPFEAIRQNMLELDIINTYLGGHRITIKGVQLLSGKQNVLHICEIGCGGGDNLAAIARWASSKNIQLEITGIDINHNCIDVATQRKDIGSKANWITSDYRNVNFTRYPDIIFSSLFCHHFTNEALIEQLQWMHRNSAKGFFINDLHRHWLAYYSIKVLTQLFSKSYLVKNDAPLSVKRGFKKEEWMDLLGKASIKAEVSWEWAFRHLVLSKK